MPINKLDLILPKSKNKSKDEWQINSYTFFSEHPIGRALWNSLKYILIGLTRLLETIERKLTDANS